MNDAALTALHVVDPKPARLDLISGGLPVTAVVTLRGYGVRQAPHGDDSGTVDLALLLAGVGVTNADGERVRGLRLCRRRPSDSGQHRDRGTTMRKVIANVTLRPGDSRAPSFDDINSLPGLTVLDLGERGDIFTGSALIAVFVE